MADITDVSNLLITIHKVKISEEY